MKANLLEPELSIMKEIGMTSFFAHQNFKTPKITIAEAIAKATYGC